MRLGLAVIAVMGGLLAAACWPRSAGAAAEMARAEALSLIADAMVSQTLAAMPAGRPPRIAVLPFSSEDVPVMPAVAAELHAGMLSALLRAGGERIHLVARESLRAIIADLDRTGAGAGGAIDPAAIVLRRARDIDLVAMGQMRRTDGGVMLSYRVVLVPDSDIIASTTPRKVPLNSSELDPTAAEHSLDQAVEAAARYFLLHAGDMNELQTGGIRFESTGAQPPFGRYLQDRMVAALEAGRADPLSGRRLTVRPAVEEQLARGAYRFQGRYWDFGAAIELRLRLTGSDGRSLGWRQRVLRASAGGLRLRPHGDFGSMRDNDGIGPFAFHLSTDRGGDPAYRIGEEVDLFVEVERDAWLYCFYVDSGGALSQILPNPHLRGGDAGAVRVAGGRRQRLIADALDYIVLRVTPPVGQELLKCFAADRDIAADLPVGLRGTSNDPLVPGLAAGLSQRFRAVPNAGIAEASVVITVHE